MKKLTFLATLLTATTLATSATAELIDLNTKTNISSLGGDVQKIPQSDKEHTFSASNARWIKLPKLDVRAIDRCECTDSGKPSPVCYTEGWTVTTKLSVDKLGNISSVKVVKSDAHRIMNRRLIRSLRRGKFMPFQKHGEAVSGYVHLPINIVNSGYNPNLHCPVVDSGETQ